MHDDYKEFTGKNLDEAMAEACAFFGLERGKLEIEILSDAKTGIFGLVGARRAVVRARRARIEALRRDIPRKEERGHSLAAEAGRRASGTSVPCEPDAPAAPDEPVGPARASAPEDLGGPGRPAEEAHGETEDANEEAPGAEALSGLDQALLRETVLEVVGRLIRPIAGDPAKTFELADGKARVRLEDVDDCGLLIGRDGQTLAALRYLAGCIVSRRMNAQVRVHIDAGDYQERQEERLRKTALHLAEKVKESGLPRSTRPLGAYQRRIIHITLQSDPEVKTYSKGEGRLKRVIVVPAGARPGAAWGGPHKEDSA